MDAGLLLKKSTLTIESAFDIWMLLSRRRTLYYVGRHPAPKLKSRFRFIRIQNGGSNQIKGGKYEKKVE
jgi:hypothetical protein